LLAPEIVSASLTYLQLGGNELKKESQDAIRAVNTKRSSPIRIDF